MPIKFIIAMCIIAQQAVAHELQVDIGDLTQQHQCPLVLPQPFADGLKLTARHIDLALPTLAIDDNIGPGAVLVTLVAGAVFPGAGTKTLEV